MSVLAIKTALSGAVFGAALTVAGMFSPDVILGQLRLEDFHMLKTFLLASASSAICITAAQRLGYISCKPRLPNSINQFSKYDGNVIGGLLLGVGLALTGACPGTVLPQVATGIASGPLVLTGGVIGGALYSRFGKKYQRSVFTQVELANPTVHEAMGISHLQGISLFVTFCLLVASTSDYIFPSFNLLVPVAWGGLLIGASQGTSLLLTGNPLGISGAYEQFGDILWWAEKSIFEPSIKTSPPQITSSMIFAIGTTVGSYTISKAIGLPAIAVVEISTFRALSGGAIMIFGSRLAGGCTSGHGISGMSQLSIASIVSVAAMFVSGIGFTAFL